MNRYAKFCVAWMCAAWPVAAMAFLDGPVPKALSRPDSDRYTNPYELLYSNEAEIQREENVTWTVFSNQADAPIFRAPEPNAEHIGQAGYLDKFTVCGQQGQFLQVTPEELAPGNPCKNVRGWINMRHLILTQRAIMDPETRVRHKVFFKVRIDSNQMEEGLNALRFRNGPGMGSDSGGGYQFLNTKDAVPTMGALFHYVYGVAFKDERADFYQNIKKFQNADYFLIGKGSSFSTNKGEQVIEGWLPRSAAILWDTRQALEKIPNRPQENWDAHKFGDYGLFLDYFALPENERPSFFTTHPDAVIVQDKGEGAPTRGQDLRDLILQTRLQTVEKNVVSEYIGFSGSRSDVEQQQEYNQFLATLQHDAKFIDLFFLVDATESMEPCLRAASDFMREMSRKINDPKLRITFRGAMYRDEAYDSPKGNYSYQQCSINTPQGLSDCFCPKNDGQCGGQASSDLRDKKPDDYREDVFNAMKTAINSWNFSNDHSIRVLVILGDAGDHERSSSPGREEIIMLLREKNILPYAVQFMRDYDDYDAKEKEAMDKFIADFRAITASLYGNFNLPNVFSLSKDELAGNITQNISSVFDSFRTLVKDLSETRIGSLSFTDMLCNEMNESEQDRQTCKKECAANPQECLKRMVENALTLGKKLRAEWIRKSVQDNPQLLNLFTAKPEMAFSTGYIALKKFDIPLTRPVLLLGEFELNDIKRTIRDIRSNYADCSSGKNYQLMVEAMSTILGELAQTNPNEVTNEQLARWLDTSLIDPNRTFLGIGEIVQKMCASENRATWNSFLQRLETSEEYINSLINIVAPSLKQCDRLDKNEAGTAEAIKKRPSLKLCSRIYRDVTDTPYYWVYPEDIFPSAQ